jgi:hypothetical protein
MRLLFTLFFIVFCSAAAICQTDLSTSTPDLSMEELRREILRMKEESRQMQLHLRRSQKEFRTGTIFYAVGLGLTILAAGNEKPSPGLVLVATGCLITGGILHIDSHKHIGRAGLVEFRRR